MIPQLKVLRLDPSLPLPERKSAQASGLDLHASADHTIAPGGVAMIGTGIAVELPEGHEGQVRPRSSLTCRGLVVPTGTIDQDYRSEIGVVIVNCSGETVNVVRGDRIAQLVVCRVWRGPVLEVHEIEQTGRGGWGSTGT